MFNNNFNDNLIVLKCKIETFKFKNENNDDLVIIFNITGLNV